jgi:uncharacterized protein (TIGR03437 family)
MPIDLGVESEQVFLIPYGTGLHFRSEISAVKATVGGEEVEVLYAGEQGDFVGLDQANVRLSHGLKGRGELEVTLKVDGKSTNTVRINVK